MNMVIKNITSQLPNQEICVVLCHDTKEYTVKAMEYLIPWLLDHGYNIQPLQFDSEPAHHGVQNEEGDGSVSPFFGKNRRHRTVPFLLS